jgi:hypothetical protein
MSAARVGLLVAGAGLAASLFLPFYAGVSGWEHWAWADVPLAVLAADLVVGALVLRRPVFAHSLVVAVLCALGIAVVLGHGFEPDAPTRNLPDLAAGPYVALCALAVGAVAALVPWPRRAAPLLLVASAAGLVAALLSGWGAEAIFLDAGGRDTTPYPNGFERWHVLDVGLLILAAALLAAAPRRLPQALVAVLAAATVLAAACVAIGSRSQVWVDEGSAVGMAMGPLAALLALAGAFAGLALATRPASSPAARAG